MAIKLNTIYKDLAYKPSLTQSGDANFLENAKSVKQALLTIINTPIGSRLFEPDFGCDIRRFIFEPIDAQTKTDIKDTVEGAIGRFEPRVSLIQVIINETTSPDGFSIDVQYRLKEVNIRDSIVVNIQRL